MAITSPVRILNQESKKDIQEHLMALSPEDRYTRFCSAVSEHAIQQYVDKLQLLGADVMYGIYDDDTKLVGLLHMPHEDKEAEIALSVLRSHRRQGIGTILFDRAILHCKGIGVTKIYANCLATNTAIRRLAANKRMKVTTDYGESIARLDTDSKNSMAAWLANVQSDVIGLFDISCKLQKQHMDNLITEVTARFNQLDSK